MMSKYRLLQWVLIVEFILSGTMVLISIDLWPAWEYLLLGVLLIGVGISMSFRRVFEQVINFFIDPSIRVDERKERAKRQAVNIFFLSSWLGLLTGFFEAIGMSFYLYTQDLANPIETFWIIPLVNLITFTIIGGFFAGLAFLSSYIKVYPLASFIITALSVVVLLSVFIKPFLFLSQASVVILSMGVGWQISQKFFMNESLFRTKGWKFSLRTLFFGLVIWFFATTGWYAIRERMAVADLSPETSGLPNVLIVMLDTVRADHLSLYGYERQTSPNIDRYAAQGIVFEQAISTAPWTRPSHASILTGRYVYEHGADAGTFNTNQGYPTITEVLKSVGYRTGAFSANDYYFNRRNGFDRGFIHFEDDYQVIWNFLNETVLGRFVHSTIISRFGVTYRIDRIRAEDVNRSFLRWVRQDTSKPFFVFLNYFDAHAPYIPPQPYRSRFSLMPNPGGRINPDWGLEFIYVPLTSEELQGEIDAYDGSIYYIDHQVNQMLTQLDQWGLLENTLVVFVSDHGELFGEHGLRDHWNSLYRELIHVPLIFWWPEKIPQGVRISQPVSLVSIPATIMELIGKKDQGIFPNDSLVPLWSGEGVYHAPVILSEVAQEQLRPQQDPVHYGGMKSIVYNNLHFIVHETFGEELYDWNADPSERRNLLESRDPRVQDDVERFRMILEQLDKP